MIIMNIFGGLGNQMFQYATGYALARHFNTELKCDMTFFEDPSTFIQRDCGISSLSTSIVPATKKEISVYKGKISEQLDRVLHPWYKRHVVYEPHYHFAADIFKGKGDAYYTGYWQSPKYFEFVAQEIRNIFLLNSYTAKMYQLALEIGEKNSISLHIRRGDYVTNKAANETLGVLPLSYYEQAIEYIQKHVLEPHFYIFSDDIEWAKEHLRIHAQKIFVSGSGLSDVEEMQLMTKCKHNILANSSFSWWGAWLGPSENKIAVAPKQWFKDTQISTKDLIPETWIQI